MRKFVAALAFTMLFCLAAGGSFAVEKAAPSDVTLTGEIVDLACYIAHGAKGPDHAVCAAKCAEMGQPVGLAASDGQMYILPSEPARPTGCPISAHLAAQTALSGPLARTA